MPYAYRFPRPALTVDCVLFGPRSGSLEVLLVERGESPFEGAWALPGGFVEIDEPISEAVSRELEEETGLSPPRGPIERLDIYADPGRDPRGRIASVGHWAMVDPATNQPTAASDAADAEWHPADDPPELAFDHADILADARRSLEDTARSGPVGTGVFDGPFPASRLADLYETILDHSVEPDALAAALVAAGRLREVEGESGAEAYVFDRADARPGREQFSRPFWESSSAEAAGADDSQAPGETP